MPIGIISSGGGGGSGSPSQKLQNFAVSNTDKVPVAGTAYLFCSEVSTASIPIVMNASGTLRGGSVAINVADLSRDYQVQILKGPISSPTLVETLNLTSGSTEATTTSFTTALVVGDKIIVRLVRTTGSGRSTFNQVLFWFDFLEA